MKVAGKALSGEARWTSTVAVHVSVEPGVGAGDGVGAGAGAGLGAGVGAGFAGGAGAGVLPPSAEIGLVRISLGCGAVGDPPHAATTSATTVVAVPKSFLIRTSAVCGATAGPRTKSVRG